MRKLIIITVLIFSIAGLRAQESVTSSGGEATGDGGTVSFTVGQVSYRTHTGTAGSLVEGVQQPYEISVVIGIDEPGIILQISAYPNPVTDHLILKIADDTSVERTPWIASLYDVKGSLIKQLIIVSNETAIDMADLQTATYFLKVINDNKEVKTFKIIKTQ
jgi:hypothetical protein